jgi:hypothetical protein
MPFSLFCGVLPGRISQFASQRKKAPGCIQSAAGEVITEQERFQSRRNCPDGCHKSTCQLESRRARHEGGNKQGGLTALAPIFILQSISAILNQYFDCVFANGFPMAMKAVI